MLTGEIQNSSIPSLRLSDQVHYALQLMDDNQVTHLPILSAEDKHAGIISEDDLLIVEDDNTTLAALLPSFKVSAVKETDHLLKALQLAAEHALSIVPVVNEENILTGTITYQDLLRHAAAFMSLNEPGALIVLEIPSNQYSFNEISKLVETNDAQITQLNTSNDYEKGLMQVTIRINKTEVSDIVATFQRYEYTIKYFFGEEHYENELKSNFDNLMNYLNI
ncbi:MAG: hypothetical protein RIR12_1955 [Bacteroidota bacterium]|jgi:CBS domain-containing protein